MKRIICALLSLIIAVSALFSVSCDGEEKIRTDREIIDEYIKRLRDGEFDTGLYGFSISDYYVIGQYKGLEYPLEEEISEDVTDAFINDYYTYVVMSNFLKDDDFAETDTPAERYDRVIIDFTGYVDGETSDGLQAQDVALVLGSHSFIGGFEDGLIGKKAGESAKLELRFSTYYQADSGLAGKDVTFDVDVKKVTRAEIPDVTVEQLNECFQSGYGSIEDIKADMKNDIRASREQNRYNYSLQYLIPIIQKSSRLTDIPQKEFEHYKNNFIRAYQKSADSASCDLETFVKNQGFSSMTDFYEAADEYAESSVETDLFVLALLEAENMTVTDRDIEEMIRKSFSQSKAYKTLDEMTDAFVSAGNGNIFYENARYIKACDFIFANSVMVNEEKA